MSPESVADHIDGAGLEWFGLDDAQAVATASILRSGLLRAAAEAPRWRRWYRAQGLRLAVAALDHFIARRTR